MRMRSARMRETLTYLYSSGSGRYWFAVQPNLNRTVADRASKLDEREVWAELEGRMRQWRARGVSTSPASTSPRPARTTCPTRIAPAWWCCHRAWATKARMTRAARQSSLARAILESRVPVRAGIATCCSSWRRTPTRWTSLHGRGVSLPRLEIGAGRHRRPGPG